MKKFKIAVVDSFQAGFGDDIYFVKEQFENYTDAVNFCKNFLDRDFAIIIKDCKNEDNFYNYWSSHGERLLITPSNNSKKSFNSNTYIRKKLNEYFKN